MIDAKQRRPWQRDDPSVMSVKVRDSTGFEVFFKNKRTSPLQKLMEVFTQWQGESAGAYRFRFGGKPIRALHTPDGIGMEDGDMIEAFSVIFE